MSDHPRTYTDADRARAVVLAATHFDAMDAETRAWLVAQINDGRIRDLGPTSAVSLLERLSAWAKTEQGQAALQ